MPLLGNFWLLSCPWFYPQTGHGHRCQPGAAGSLRGELLCHILEYLSYLAIVTSGNSMEGAAVSVVQLLLVQAALGPLDNPL